MKPPGHLRACLPGAVLALAGMCMPAPSFAQSPGPLAPGERPAPGSTEAELWYGMDQAEKTLRQSPLVVRDPALQAYVEGVACRVAGAHCRDLRVYVVDVPVFNASMAPNGVTLVFTGALLRMHDEAELAMVLGHEFAHYRQRHSLESWRTAKRTTAFLGTFGLVTWGVGLPIAGELAALSGVSALYKQSRDNEREADRIGFNAAVAQGYDPAAAARLWQRLLREERADTTHRNRAVFASHPQTAERVQDVRAAAAALLAEGRPSHTALEAYRDAIRAHRERWLAAELSRRSYDTTIQAFGELHGDPVPGFTGLHAFYLGEAHRRRGRPGDRERAAALYAEALAQPDAPAAAWREQGMLLRERGERVGAIDALRHYLAAAPDADDAPVVRHYLSRLEQIP